MDSLSHLLALLAPRCEVNLHCRFGGPLAGRAPANAAAAWCPGTWCCAARGGSTSAARLITCAREMSSSCRTVRRI